MRTNQYMRTKGNKMDAHIKNKNKGNSPYGSSL